MKAAQLFRELSRESWWASQPRKMRWIAARYYAGVESFEELKARGESRPVLDQTPRHGDYWQPAELSADQIQQIIRLR